MQVARVLLYHWIEDRDGFLRQLDHIARWQSVAPGEVLSREGVCISFDDGWADLPWAFDAIRARGLRAVVFLSTRLPQLRESGDWELFVKQKFPRLSARVRLVPASWDELKDAVQKGLVVGAHTHTHTRIGPGADLQQELRLPISLIRENLGITTDLFAYPYGRRRDVNPEWIPGIREAGYRMAFIGHGWRAGPRTHPMLVPRHPVRSYSVQEVEAIMSGKRDLREKVSWWVQGLMRAF